MTRALMAIVALALVLAGVAVAQAPQTNAPPGNSAIDEYLETVPGAAGNARPRPPAASGGAAALSPPERARLERLGADGRALADAVDATAPAPSRPSRPSNDEIAVAQNDGRAPLGEVLGTFTGSDGGNGMGIALPAILLAALIGAFVIVLRGRRTTS